MDYRSNFWNKDDDIEIADNTERIDSLEKAYEKPIIGESTIATDELFLDGVKSGGITSKGRIPVEYSEDYEPALVNVDGSEVANPIVKFANRGVHGYFGQYENIIDDESKITEYLEAPDEPNPISTAEGSWIKLTSQTDITYSRINWEIDSSIQAIGKEFYFSIDIRKGTSLRTGTYWVGPDIVPNVIIAWGDSISFNSNYGFAYFLNEEKTIARVYYASSLATVTVGNRFILQVERDVTDYDIGEYCYYRNPMIVENVSYPVPYTKGTHFPTYGKYDFDWASSDSWTIEGWFKYTADSVGNNSYYLSNRVESTRLTDSFIVYKDTANLSIRFGYYSSGISSFKTFVETPITGNYYHLKIIFIDNTEVKLYVNGVLSSLITEAPIFKDYGKVFDIGNGGSSSSPDKESYLNDFIEDLVIKPYADESTDHYTSGLPYYDPDSQYLVNGLGKISKDVISGKHLVSQYDDGSGIYEEYTEGDETVIKYNSGKMVQYGKDSSGLSVVTVTFLETFIGNPLAFISPYATSDRTATMNNVIGTGLTIYKWQDGGTPSFINTDWIAIGRWK